MTVSRSGFSITADATLAGVRSREPPLLQSHYSTTPNAERPSRSIAAANVGRIGRSAPQLFMRRCGPQGAEVDSASGAGINVSAADASYMPPIGLTAMTSIEDCGIPRCG